MKIVCFGDFHAHLFSEFSEVDDVTGNSRFTQQLKVLDDIKTYCIQNKVKTVLFAGDLFHKRVTVNTIVYNRVRDKIKQFGENGITLLMLVGNHDQVDNSDFPEHSLHSFKELDYVMVLDKFEEIQLSDELRIYPVPYSKNVELILQSISRYEKIAKSSNGVNIVLGHVGISGAFVGKGNYSMSDSFSLEDFKPEVFDFGVFGHFHKRQFLDINERFFYTGAPIQHSFNDEGEEKGFYVIDTKQNNVEFVGLNNPKFVTVTNYKKEDIVQLKGNYIRFQCDTDDVENLSSIVPKDLKHRIEPQKIYKEEKRVDVDIAMSLEEVVKVYAKKFKPEAINEGLEILEELKSN